MSAIDDLRWRKFQVLDQGHLALVDCMASDADVVREARTSFGIGTRQVSDDRTLIRYLVRRREMGPFEHAVIKTHWRIPMDAWRQVSRYRTGSISEYSTRYSEAIDATQVTPPDGWRLQAKDNKQGSEGYLEAWGRAEQANAFAAGGTPCTPGEHLSWAEGQLHSHARKVYSERLAFGVAREQARKDLPLCTYTEAVLTMNLRNVLHACLERMDGPVEGEGNAQKEARSYFNVLGREIIAKLFPLTWEAWLDYHHGAVTLSRLEIEAIRSLMAGDGYEFATGHIENKRERAEFAAKAGRLGLDIAKEVKV